MEILQDNYNLALDCVDKHAGSLINKHKTALLYLKEEAPGKLREPPLRLSFSSLRGLTNAAANMFRDLGVQKGERILLRLPDGPEFPINFLGAIKAGAIPIPSSPLLTWHELEFMIQDSGATVLITTQELLPPELSKNPNFAPKHILVICEKELPQSLHSSPFPPEAGTLHFSRWQDLLKKASAQFVTDPTSAEDPAFWLYTSGTTGRPKAVIHAHRNIRAHDARATHWQDMKAGDIIFNTSSLNWSYALTCGMLDVWRHGLTSLVFQGSLTPENICEMVKRYGVTTFMSVPGIYRRLVNDWKSPPLPNPLPRGERAIGPESFSQVRVCLSAGESLSSELRKDFKAFTGLEIHEGLGMTEHSVYLAQPFNAPIVAASCGQPLPQNRVAILREDLSETDPEETGILASHRSCEGLMLGYHRRPEEESIKGDWFLSGDLAKRDAAGNFYFLGRKDDMLNAGGYRISPLEVEAALNQHEAVAESAVAPFEVEPGKILVHAFVVLKAGFPAVQETAKAILAFAATQLAKYKMPREVVFLKSLPQTANGKIKRKELFPMGPRGLK